MTVKGAAYMTMLKTTAIIPTTVVLSSVVCKKYKVTNIKMAINTTSTTRATKIFR